MVDLRVTINTGAEAVLGGVVVEDFRASLRGELLRTGDDGYDAARKVFNGMLEVQLPACPQRRRHRDVSRFRSKDALAVLGVIAAADARRGQPSRPRQDGVCSSLPAVRLPHRLKLDRPRGLGEKRQLGA